MQSPEKRERKKRNIQYGIDSYTVTCIHSPRKHAQTNTGFSVLYKMYDPDIVRIATGANIKTYDRSKWRKDVGLFESVVAQREKARGAVKRLDSVVFHRKGTLIYFY